MPGFRHDLLVASLVLLLAGCSADLPDSNANAPQARGFLAGLRPAESAENERTATRPKLPRPLSEVTLSGGTIRVAGPDGYCIDPITAKDSASRGFALVASCRVLSSGELGSPVPPVLMTVTVGPRADTGDLPAPGDFAALGDTTLLGGQARDGLVLAHLATGGRAGLPNGDRRHWRGAFVLNDRLIGLALYAPQGSAQAGPEGAALLQALRARITALTAQDAADEVAEAQPAQNGFLGRLFNR